MICLEDYEFSYDIFLAEQGLFEDMVDLDITITNESVGLISIQEGMKDTLLKYLTKIKNAVQKVWEKFKNMLTDAVDSKYLNMIKDRVKEFDPNCTITNYPDLTSKFDDLRPIEFKYEDLRNTLDSVDHFIDTHYSNIIPKTDPNQSLDDRIQKNCMTLSTIVCHNPELMKVYNYCANDFKNDMKVLEDDIKKFNANQDEIINTAQQGFDNVQVRTNSTNGETTITNDSYEYKENYILSEAGINGVKLASNEAPAGSAMKGGNKQASTNQTTNQQTTTKVEVNANNGTQKDATDTNLGFKQQEKAETETDKAKNDQILKDVQVYMSATCGILSAKLKVCRNKYKKYMKILKHFLPITDAVANRNKPVQKVTNVNRTNYEVKV